MQSKKIRPRRTRLGRVKLITILFSIALLGAACTPGTVTVQSTTDGGIWTSSNNGETWEQMVNIYTDRASKKTISNLDIKKIVFSTKDERKIFIISERNGLWVSWNSGHNWDLVLPNISVNDIAIHPDNSRRIYAAVGSSIAVSDDEAVTWKSTYTSDNASAFISSIVLNPDNPAIVYASTSDNNILISDNSGISWRIHAEIGAKAVLQDMQFHLSQTNKEKAHTSIYAIDKTKGLAVSHDTGKNWEFFDIKGDPRDYKLIPAGIIYASSTGLFRSLNFGNDWTDLPLISGKNGSNIYSIAVDPDNALEIFYGTKSTLYYSFDGGFNWIPRSLPTARAVSELMIHPDQSNTIYMGVSRFR